jgi:CRP-like cAMP-binding protein
MADNKKASIDWESVLHGVFRGKTLVEYGEGRSVFLQGQPADALFYIRRGKIKLSIISHQGKEAIVAILGKGDFFGEGCLAGQALRIASFT